jgi:hypothetical protein
MGHSGIYGVAMIDSTHIKVPRSAGGEKREPSQGRFENSLYATALLQDKFRQRVDIELHLKLHLKLNIKVNMRNIECR